eukprot:18916_6
MYVRACAECIRRCHEAVFSVLTWVQDKQHASSDEHTRMAAPASLVRVPASVVRVYCPKYLSACGMLNCCWFPMPPMPILPPVICCANACACAIIKPCWKAAEVIGSIPPEGTPLRRCRRTRSAGMPA